MLDTTWKFPSSTIANRSPKDPGKTLRRDDRRLKSGEPVLYKAIAANNSILTTLTLFNPSRVVVDLRCRGFRRASDNYTASRSNNVRRHVRHIGEIT